MVIFDKQALLNTRKGRILAHASVFHSSVQIIKAHLIAAWNKEWSLSQKSANCFPENAFN